MTPQQNGVVEIKNKTLQEMARVVLHTKSLPLYFLAKVVNTLCHIHNRISLRLGTKLANYQIWRGRKPIKYFHIIGSNCFILNDLDYHHKWNSKSDEGIFLDYSVNSKVFCLFNKRTKTVIESINVQV